MDNNMKKDRTDRIKDTRVLRKPSPIISVFKWLAIVFAFSVLTQTFLAGLALFGDFQWTSHINFARYLSIIPVVMLVISFIAKLPVSLRIQCGALIVMIILMFVSAIFSSKIGFLSALHPVIALMLFWRTMTIARQTNELLQSSQIQRGEK